MTRRTTTYFLVAQCALAGAAFLSSSSRPNVPTRQPRLHHAAVVGQERWKRFATSVDETNEKDAPPHLVFPGGGIYFYWQAGVVTYLREQGYNLDSVTAAGASAGALTATLAATNVDFYKATQVALDLAGQAGVWDRSGGLQGIWGPMIYDWLDELLPENAVELVNGRLSLLVTPIPTLGKTSVNEFRDREDLIRCNMASVHLPWFLDGKLTTSFRDSPHIDGSFLSEDKHYLPERKSSEVLVLDYNQDPAYASTSMLDFVTALSPDSVFQLLEDGKNYAKQLEERGELVALSKRTGSDESPLFIPTKKLIT